MSGYHAASAWVGGWSAALDAVAAQAEWCIVQIGDDTPEDRDVTNTYHNIAEFIEGLRPKGLTVHGLDNYPLKGNET